MKRNRILSVILALMVCFVAFNSVSADSITDVQAIEGVYKVSDDKSKMDIPFLRVVRDRIEVDKPYDQTSLLLTASSIDVASEMKGLQMMVSKDTVRINGETEYPMICTASGVVIKGTVEKTAFICAGSSITIDEGADIKGTIICVTPKLEVNAPIKGNIIGATENVSINANVEGTIRLATENLQFADKVTVGNGIQVLTENANLKIPDNIGDSTINVKEKLDSVKAGFSIGTVIVDIIAAVVPNIIVYLLLLVFVKKEKIKAVADKVTDVRDTAKKGIKAYVALLLGSLIAFLTLPIITSFSVSVLIITIGTLVIGTLLKSFVIATFVAELAERKEVKLNRILTVVLTLFALEIAYVIPFIGGVIKFVAFIAAAGIIIAAIKGNKTESKEAVKA